MDFSIILASRERPTLLTNLLKSIEDTISNINLVEVFVGIDNDDTPYQDLALLLSERYPFVKFCSRDRSPFLNKDYLNWLTTDHSKGRFLIIGNDDMEFKTPKWDDILRTRLDAYLADKPDGIVYGYMSDALINRNGMNYCCFPLVSRAGVNALGFAMPPEYKSWNADIATWQIYATFGRICDLSEVMIEHISYHSGKRDRDHINFHVASITNGLGSVNEHIERMRPHIK